MKKQKWKIKNSRRENVGMKRENVKTGIHLGIPSLICSLSYTVVGVY